MLIVDLLYSLQGPTQSTFGRDCSREVRNGASRPPRSMTSSELRGYLRQEMRASNLVLLRERRALGRKLSTTQHRVDRGNHLGTRHERHCGSRDIERVRGCVPSQGEVQSRRNCCDRQDPRVSIDRPTSTSLTPLYQHTSMLCQISLDL